MFRFLILICLSCASSVAIAQEKVAIFGGTYLVVLPPKIGVSNPDLPSVPLDEIGQQFSHLNADSQEDYSIPGPNGMRINLTREFTYGPTEARPELVSIFSRRRSNGAGNDISAELGLLATNRFQELAVTKRVVQLDMLRLGETWWGYHNGYSYLLDRTVASIKICKYIRPEAICVMRYLSQATDWRGKLDLPPHETTMPVNSITKLLKLPELAKPIALLGSVERSSNYRPCCRPLPN